MEWGGWSGWVGLNPILVSALAPFGLVEVGAEIGAELDNFEYVHRFIFDFTKQNDEIALLAKVC